MKYQNIETVNNEMNINWPFCDNF